MLIKSERRSNHHIHTHLLVRTVYYIFKSSLFGVYDEMLAASDRRRFADRFGRKTSFYLAWLWLVVVSDALGEEGTGAESRNELMISGLRFPQHGQKPVCMGESKSLPSTVR